MLDMEELITTPSHTTTEAKKWGENFHTIPRKTLSQLVNYSHHVAERLHQPSARKVLKGKGHSVSRKGSWNTFWSQTPKDPKALNPHWHEGTPAHKRLFICNSKTCGPFVGDLRFDVLAGCACRAWNITSKGVGTWSEIAAVQRGTSETNSKHKENNYYYQSYILLLLAVHDGHRWPVQNRRMGGCDVLFDG